MSETIHNGKLGILSNSLKPFDNRRAENPIDNFKVEDSQSFRKRDPVFQTNQRRTRKCVFCQAEAHKSQNVLKLPHRQNAENFWVQKGSVSVALVRTNHRNAKAPRPVNIVVSNTTPQSVAYQRK